MSDAEDARYPAPMKVVLDTLGLARQEGLDVEGQRDLVASVFPRLRPHLVEGPFGVVVPHPDTPPSLLGR